MNECDNMSSEELVSISKYILTTDHISANDYSDKDLYDKIKAEYVSYFKNEEVARYTFNAKRNEWDEYTNDVGASHLVSCLSGFTRDPSDTENLLDLLITLIIWCKKPECEF